MKNSLLTIFTIFTVLIINRHVVQAAETWSWVGPVEVLKDNFSKFGGSFGFTYSLDAGDCCCGGPATEDSYPKRIQIDRQGNIIIGDWEDAKVHVFNNAGVRLNVIKRDPSVKCDNGIYWPGTIYANDNKIIVKRGYCAEVYDYRGKLLWTMQPDSSIYPEIVDVFPGKIVFKDLLKAPYYASRDKNEPYRGYSIYDMNGIKLSHVDDYLISHNIDNTDIRHGSITYRNIYKKDEGWLHWVQFGQDDDKFLYIGRLEKSPKGYSKDISQFPSGKVDVYDTIGSRIYTLLLPLNEYSKSRRTCEGPEGGAAFAGRDVINEYAKGFAVSNTGDIYTTLYVPRQLKIIKWLRIDLDTPIPVAILSRLTKSSLRVLRNEIIARKGRVFTSKDLREIFEPQPWYKPKADYTDNDLSGIDRDNIATILKIENTAK
jgi:hypothetical protein